MVEILSLVLQHDEQAVLAAVEMALQAGVATKTHILNLLHRLTDGAASQVPPIEAPQGPTCIYRTNTKANTRFVTVAVQSLNLATVKRAIQGDAPDHRPLMRFRCVRRTVGSPTAYICGGVLRRAGSMGLMRPMGLRSGSSTIA